MTPSLESYAPQQVIVTNIKMPFWSMVWFMVKWSLASIPALILLTIIVGVIFVIVTAFVGVGVAGLQQFVR